MAHSSNGRAFGLQSNVSRFKSGCANYDSKKYYRRMRLLWWIPQITPFYRPNMDLLLLQQRHSDDSGHIR